MHRNILLIILIYIIHLKTKDFIICPEANYKNRDYWEACQNIKTLTLLYQNHKNIIDKYYLISSKEYLKNLRGKICLKIITINPEIRRIYPIIKKSMDFINNNKEEFLKYVHEPYTYGKWPY